jgi:phytoene dehydrogenase-like protein
LINASLGITIRGAGLSRATGGMRGFWQSFVRHYQSLGGVLALNTCVKRIVGSFPDFEVFSAAGSIGASQVVSALPLESTERIAPPPTQTFLRPFLERDKHSFGGAVVVFLGVPESEVAHQTFTHHQLLESYSERLGNGNNMFISVSAKGDMISAPAGNRAVMVSTHCDLSDWANSSPTEYGSRKQAVGARLLSLARRVYPRLGEQAIVYEVGTPKTYERFTHRPRGAVGGVRQSLLNTNQRTVPHETACRGFWLAGDTTWPGLGTVACVLGSRIVAEGVAKLARRRTDRVRFRSVAAHHSCATKRPARAA